MEIEYKNYYEFGELAPNESFIYEEEIYIKIEKCQYGATNHASFEKNAIKLAGMSFHKFDSRCKVKPVKAKVVVEDI